jgi:uncharacterized membrane protein YfcA
MRRRHPPHSAFLGKVFPADNPCPTSRFPRLARLSRRSVRDSHSMWQSLADFFWLCLAAFFAGGINALAGGGTLLTFPTLTGVLEKTLDTAAAEVLANGTNTIVVVPASVGSAWAFRRETYELRRLLFWLLVPSVFGGIIGAWLLISFPQQFSVLVPWLILAAAMLFTIQPYVSQRLTKAAVKSDGDDARMAIRSPSLAAMMLLQLFIAIYGGYFGAGIGILMLSGLGMMGLTNIHQMNGLKAVLGSTINGIAALVFIGAQNVHWRYALAMMATSLVGGFVAAHYSRQLPAKAIRWFVIGVGFFLATYYFAKTYLNGGI